MYLQLNQYRVECIRVGDELSKLLCVPEYARRGFRFNYLLQTHIFGSLYKYFLVIIVQAVLVWQMVLHWVISIFISGNNATIKVSYTAKAEYQLADMSPAAWQNFSARYIHSCPDGAIVHSKRLWGFHAIFNHYLCFL